MSDQLAERLINAFQRGREIAHYKRIDEEEQEDRDIEKQKLQHQLKALKIGEKIKARDEAKGNYDMYQGRPEADMPWDGTSMKSGQKVDGAVGEFETPRRQAPMINFGGIEELGVPGVDARPQSMEEVLAQLARQKSTEARSRGYELSEGESVALPGKTADDPFEVVKGQPRTFAPARPRAPIKMTSRATGGVETDTYVDADTLMPTGLSATRQPLPVRPRAAGGGGSGLRLDMDDLEEIGKMADRGDYDFTKLPESEVGQKIQAFLGKRGINVAKARTDLLSFNAYMRNLNTGRQQEVIQASHTVMSQLDDFDELIKNNAPSADIDAATAELGRSMASLRSDANGATDKEIASAIKDLTPGLWDKWANNRVGLLTKTKNWRNSLKYRVASAKKSFAPVDSVTVRPPGSAGLQNGAGQAGPNDAQIAAALAANGKKSDPATVAKVKASPELMNALFPRQ